MLHNLNSNLPILMYRLFVNLFTNARQQKYLLIKKWNLTIYAKIQRQKQRQINYILNVFGYERGFRMHFALTSQLPATFWNILQPNKWLKNLCLSVEMFLIIEKEPFVFVTIATFH